MGFLSKNPFPSSGVEAAFVDQGFHEFRFLPNMVMGMNPSWTSFEDYLADLQSKYRVRAKRAFKKAKKSRRCPWICTL